MALPPDSKARRAQDLDLIERVLQGNRVARRGFARRMECVPKFLAAANRRMGEPLGREELADLSQDTLVVIWRKLRTFEARATLESWSWRFCQLELANRVQKRFRRAAFAGPALEEVSEFQEAPNETPTVEYEHLEESLQALGPPEEEVVRLKHFEHLKFSEVAERLGVSANTAKTRYYRGILWLKQHLETGGERGEYS